MAILAPSLLGSPAPRSTATDPLLELNRLLSRLQQTILRADIQRERRLRIDEYERKKAQNNVDHARTLLTRLELDAQGIKILNRRQDLQSMLVRNREVIEQLTERLQDLGAPHHDSTSTGGGGSGRSDTEDVDDVLAEVLAKAVPPTQVGAGQVEASNPPALDQTPLTTQSAQSGSAAKDITTSRPALSSRSTSRQSSSLRPRGKQCASAAVTDPSQDTAITTATPSTSTQLPSRSKLFGNRSADNPGMSSITTTETILDHQRAEQDALTEAMARMATDLKLSTLSFAEALEEDTEVLKRTGEGLDKNEMGLESAARRMGALARMSEGTGWWGRIMLYIWIYGLMLLLLVIVFVLPKLRF